MAGGTGTLTRHHRRWVHSSFPPSAQGVPPPLIDRCTWWSAPATSPAEAMSSVSLGRGLAVLQQGVREPRVAGEAGVGGRRSRAVAASTTFFLAAHEVPTRLTVPPATTLASTRRRGTATTAAVVGAGGASTATRLSHWLPRCVGGQAEYPSRQPFFPPPLSVNAPHCFGRPHPSLVAATPAPYLDRRRTLTTCTRPVVAEWTMTSNQRVPAKMAARLRRPLIPSPTSGSLQAEAAVRCRRRSPGLPHTRGWPPPLCCGGSL